MAQIARGCCNKRVRRHLRRHLARFRWHTRGCLRKKMLHVLHKALAIVIICFCFFKLSRPIEVSSVSLSHARERGLHAYDNWKSILQETGPVVDLFDRRRFSLTCPYVRSFVRPSVRSTLAIFAKSRWRTNAKEHQTAVIGRRSLSVTNRRQRPIVSFSDCGTRASSLEADDSAAAGFLVAAANWVSTQVLCTVAKSATRLLWIWMYY